MQKIPSKSYLQRVEEIYKAYRMYELSEGHEQLKFEGGVPRTRSDIIIDNIGDHIPDGGDFLDIGTGSGVFLTAVKKRFGTRANLYAQDVSAVARGKLMAALPIERFYVGNLTEIDQQFDVISMIHVLEHVPEPLRLLEQVSRLLKNDGVLVVQVPDLEETVFDTIIFDHVFHFSSRTVLALLGRVFSVHGMPYRKINNEITVLAGKSPGPLRNLRDAEPRSEKIDLSRVSKVASFLTHTSERMAVFGVAPTGTFCGAVLGEQLECFVDEDTSIQFKRHLGKLILPPDQVNTDLRVFLPTNRNSGTIRSRLDRLRFITEADF